MRDEHFPCFHIPHALEIRVYVHTNPYSRSLRQNRALTIYVHSYLCPICSAVTLPTAQPDMQGWEKENALKLLCQCLRVKDYPTVLNTATTCNVFSLRRSWKQRGLVIWKGEISHHFTPSPRGHWDCDWYEKSPEREVPDDLWGPCFLVFFFPQLYWPRNVGVL